MLTKTLCRSHANKAAVLALGGVLIAGPRSCHNIGRYRDKFDSSSSSNRQAETRALTSSCAWPIVTNAQKVNVAYPDTDATYWTTPYRVEPGTRFIVKGTFPNARFMSFNTYDSTGGAFTTNNVPGAIFDYQISPNPGSTNPYQHTTRRSGKFRGDVISSTRQQRFQSAGPVRRARFATEHDPKRTHRDGSGQHRLPTHAGVPTQGCQLQRDQVALNLDHHRIGNPNDHPLFAEEAEATERSDSWTRCRRQAAVRNIAARIADEGNPATGPVPTQRAGSAPSIEFARATAATTNSVFPNSASAYVSALFTPNPNRVVLVRAKAPRTPR